MFKFLNEPNFANEKHFFIVQQSLMQFLGLSGYWNMKLQTTVIRFHNVVLALINECLLLSTVYFILTYVYDNRADWQLSLKAVAPLATAFVSAVKLVIFVWLRNQFQYLFATLYKDVTKSKRKISNIVHIKEI